VHGVFHNELLIINLNSRFQAYILHLPGIPGENRLMRGETLFDKGEIIQHAEAKL
jgi:hypothetical protein